MPDVQPQYQGPAQAQPGSNPDERLAALKQSLQTDQTQIDSLTKDRDALTAEVGAFAVIVDDVKKVLAGYTAAYTGLDADITALDGYDQSKMGFVLCKLSDARQKQVDKLVCDFDAKELAAKKQAADTLAAGAAKAKAESDTARGDHQAAQDAYNAMKALQKSLADRDAAAKKLTTEIDGYEGKKNYEAMYFRLKDALEPAAKDLRTSLVPLDTFKDELYQAANWIHETWKTARDKKDAAAAAAAAADTAKAAYDAAVNGRTAELLKRIAALPPAPVPVPAPVATSQAPAVYPA